MKVLNVKLSSIKNATENYRLDASEKDVSGLMASIKKTGMINPVTVKLKGANSYELLAGFRRFNAVKKLKHKTIAVNIVAQGINSTILNLVENMQRENTSSYEIGRGIFKTMKKDKLSSGEIGVLLGMTKTTVENYLNLYRETPVEFRDKVKKSTAGGARGRTKGMISNGVASAIINLKKRGAISSKEKKELFKKAASDSSFTANKIRAVVAAPDMTKTLAKSLKAIKTMTVTFQISANQYKKLGNKPHDKIRKVISKELNLKML